jgi:hypothetical protein
MKVNPSPEGSDASTQFFRRRTNSERGSALLIVFLFAAFVAIMLYREMPVFAFEAQRQKEQMLIDRGAQYKRGVKLFYKKFGMYPASLDQLENTNRLRFLRHRYKDPFTGKDDWRLLHMGPGGMLVDSKVNPLKTNNQAGNASGFGTNAAFGNNANSAATSFGADSNPPASSAFGRSSRASTSSGFGSNTSSFGFGSKTASSSFGSKSTTSGFSSFSNNNFSSFGQSGSGSGSDQGGAVVQPVPKRPPAVAANGAVPTANTASAPTQDASGLNQPDETTQVGETTAPGEGAQPLEPEQVAQPNPGGTDRPGHVLQTENGLVVINDEAGPNQTSPTGGAQGANSMNAIRRMLTNPNAQVQAPGAGGFRRTSGGLAGIASKAQGRTIKVVNDQLDYSLWEFYYDPAKDVKQALLGGTGMGGAPGAGTNTFNRTVINARRPVPSSPPAPSSAPTPTVAPTQPTEFEPNPNPPLEVPPPDETPNPDDPNSNDRPPEPP